MIETFEDHYVNDKLEDKKNNPESFVFPKESPETKKAIDKAEDDINGAVKIFANSLDEISPWLTKELLNIFEDSKNDIRFKWLSESDLWLHALWALHETKNIPDPLENILQKMLELLTQYKSLREKSKTLEEMLRACASAESASNIPIEEQYLTSIFKPSTSHQRWRDRY